MRGRGPVRWHEFPTIGPSQKRFERTVSVGQMWGTSGPKGASTDPRQPNTPGETLSHTDSGIISSNPREDLHLRLSLLLRE